MADVTLQVVAAVGEVEALVAQWGVGNLLIAEGHHQTDPVVERRIDNLVVSEVAASVGNSHVANPAAPTFDQGDNERIGGQVPRCNADRAGMKCVQVLQDEFAGALDFEPADIGPGKDVARRPGGDWNLRGAEDAHWKVLPHVAFDTASALRGADDPERFGVGRFENASVLKAGLDGEAVPQQL